MEPESSSPHSQAHPTCPYPELAPSSPHTSHFPKIHPNIILPSTPGSPQWSPSLRFPHQNPVHTSPLHHTRYMPRPSHSSWFYQTVCPCLPKMSTCSVKRYGSHETRSLYFSVSKQPWIQGNICEKFRVPKVHTREKCVISPYERSGGIALLILNP